MSAYRMMKLRKNIRYALFAGMAGAFLIPQISFAAPTGEQNLAGSAVVSRSGATTSITASDANNVISWADYSVGNGEIVQYDGGAQTNNYLNIVRGGNSSVIDGNITGGNNVYIVNPNGVIFGKTASVNVGTLHVSTQDNAALSAMTSWDGSNPLGASPVGKADVVNMGTINATSVEVVGKSIRFLNAADVHSSSVVMRTDTANDGTAHIGYKTTAPTSGYTVNGSAATAANNYYRLVSNATEMSNINTTNLAGNYMLENDIDMTGVTAPIGGNTYAAFTGKFDGNFYKIRNLNITGVDHAALFGRVSGARIENLGVVAPTIAGNNTGGEVNTAGGIAGEATGNTVLKNVYVEGGSITGESGRFGGIVGRTQNTKIDGSYNTSAISSIGGGIIGFSDTGTEVTNTYNKPESVVAGDSYFIRVIDPDDGTTIRNSYTTSNKFSTTQSFTSAKVSGNYIIDSTTGKAKPVITGPTPSSDEYDAQSSSTYSGWDINNNGDPGAKWRIYEGRTTPLLTAFMDGTATATYNYRYFNQDGSVVGDTENTPKSNNGADVTGLTYNSKYLRIVDADTPDTPGGKSKIQYEPSVDTNKVEEYTYTNSAADKANGIRNAGTKAIVWSDQHGPNLRGVNVTIGQRKVSLAPNDIGTLTRVYNGKTDVKAEFEAALKGGGKSGITADDLADHSVGLDTSHLTARMADKNVGEDKEVTFGGSITFDSTKEDSKNYTFDSTSLSNIKGKITITEAPLYLTIQKKKADAKVYDGTSTVVDAAMLQSGGTPNIALNKAIAAGTKGEIMTDDGGTRDNVDLAATTDPTYTDASGNKQVHAGDHKLKYSDVTLQGNDAQNYKLLYTPEGGSETEVTGGDVYLDGTIDRRRITTDSFTVYKKSDNSAAEAAKVYDGNNTYTFDKGSLYLSTNAGATGDTGIVSRDQGHITFDLTGDGKGHFKKADGTTDSKDVKTAKKIAYSVVGTADNEQDADGKHLLSDYYIIDKSSDNELATGFNAAGEGEITPKMLTATKKSSDPITKVYDALADHTNGNRNKITGDALVTLSGVVSGDTITNTTTATYASKDVAYSGGVPTTQNVTYNASFTIANADEADNYTFDTTPNTTTVTRSTSLTGIGKITPRSVTVTFGKAKKVYDGTASNSQIAVSSLDDGLSGAVFNTDHITAASFSTTGVTSQFGDNTGVSFTANKNTGSHTVKYTGIGNSLGTNYSIENTQYGEGEITRRRIDPSGFKVYNSDNTVATATKVYDGNIYHTLAPGAYLTAEHASGDTGIVADDYGKVTFALKNNTKGKFSGDVAGDHTTSHVSEAHYVAYDVEARTSDAANSPLSNYTFGTTAQETAGTLKNLEDVHGDNSAHVTAAGSITPANLRATEQRISKRYDGKAEHTDGNRNDETGGDVVRLAGLITDSTDSTVTNTSSALYADKNVAYDGSGNVTTKDVTYTAQLTGKYADDYQIVDAANAVISTIGSSGDNKTVTAALGLKNNMGTITRRKLNMEMRRAEKPYDGTSTNADITVDRITDDPKSPVINAILAGDNISATDLSAKWQAAHTATPAAATSDYGRGTGSEFTADSNASNGTDHTVRYTGLKSAFDAYGSNAKNYEVDDAVYGTGTINRRNINPNNFQVVDTQGNASNATKTYDGTSDYKIDSGWSLSPSSGPGTGLITQDQGKILFTLGTGGAKFTKSDGTTYTSNVADAAKVAYNVLALTAPGNEYLLKNYTLNGQNLESGTAKVTGNGSITRRVLTLGLVQNSGINKVYDGSENLVDAADRHWNAFAETDTSGNVRYADVSKAEDKLVTTDGTSFTITSRYTDKNVARDAGNHVIDKNVTYNITITGGNASNYAFNKAGTKINAEDGLTLTATGKITPKDLSGAFKKITKVYDGTRNVKPGDVGFTAGAVIGSDIVTLDRHAESFQSKNVRGDGTTAVIDGTAQKNWVNYSNLKLGGADAGNYNLAETAKGLGEITPFTINAGNMRFNASQATKVYDGTKTVKHNESAAASDIKNYITNAEVNLGTIAVPHWVSVGTDHVTVKSADYDNTANVNNGTSQGVTYKLAYDTGSDNGNFVVASGTELQATGTGIITPKTVNATINGSLTKTYDATTNVIGAAKNGAGKVVAGADELVTLEGLVGSDKNTTTAVYSDKNAGTGNRTVNYTIQTNTEDASNYTIKVNGTAVTAPYATNNNTITKRKVNLKFADVSRQYNGVSGNTEITPSLSNAGDAAVLNTDNAGLVDGANKLVGLTGITSDYGTGTTDATFTADPNAGTNKNVQYRGIQRAMGTALGTNAGNYEFADTGYGKGRIDKAQINGNNVTFTAHDAHKVYDGTTVVKYNGSSDANAVKNYISNIGVTSVDGHYIPLGNDVEMDVANTHYSSPNATNGTPDTVTYRFRIKSNNFTNNGKDIFDATTHGTIDRRTINLDLKQKTGIDKIYDANADLVDTNTNHYSKFTDDDRLGNVTYAAGTTNDGKLVRMSNGTAVNDGAQMNITARYADQNVVRDAHGDVTAKNINYNVKIAGSAGQNYRLQYGMTTVNAESGLNIGAQGTISPRKLTLTFANVRKQYDTTANNADKNISDVIADNSDGRGKSTLDADGVVESSFDTTSVTSEYGTGNTDDSFQANPNVVSDTAKKVIENGKDVRYSSLKNTLAAQTYAGNYEVEDTAYGKGTITKAQLSADQFHFDAGAAIKEYDGTRKVKYNGSDTLEDVKRYFGANSTVEIGGVHHRINLADFTLKSAEYNDENVAFANKVKYGIQIKTDNFELIGGGDIVPKEYAGNITQRNLAAHVPKHIYKEYDGTQALSTENQALINKMVQDDEGLIVSKDKGKVHLNVQGTYAGKNATTDTKETAEARDEHSSNVVNVNYTLSLSGDAAAMANYTVGGGTTTGKGDIYRKTLTADVARKVKDYDGTAAVKDLTAGDITFHGVVSGDTLSLDQAAVNNKIQGTYADSNVSRDANRDVTDKAVSYTGVDAALSDYESRDTTNTAKNYRLESGTVSYTAAQGKGRINPRSINKNDITFEFKNATKEYDGDTFVKHNGKSDAGSIKNYLNRATYRSGLETIELDKGDLSVDASGTYYDNANVNGGASHDVTYALTYTGGNFEIIGGNTFTKTAANSGYITPRKLIADLKSLAPIKTYDGTSNIAAQGKDLVNFKHYSADGKHGADGIVDSDIKNDSTAEFVDKNVAWEDYASGKVKNKDVIYKLLLSGDKTANYELIDENGHAVSPQTSAGKTTIRHDVTAATGRINPVDIMLKSHPKTIWINEGLPPRDSYTGSPSGTGYAGDGMVNNEVLPGEIYYDSPDARLRMGDYAINGYYRPGVGDTVYRNYRFVQDPANAAALHVGPYIPDANYYNIMTQNKMLPDEYVYENASLDRRGNFGRRAEAAVEYTDPALNSMQDGKNVRTPDIYATDDAVFALMDQVFG